MVVLSAGVVLGVVYGEDSVVDDISTVEEAVSVVGVVYGADSVVDKDSVGVVVQTSGVVYGVDSVVLDVSGADSVV